MLASLDCHATNIKMMIFSEQLPCVCSCTASESSRIGPYIARRKRTAKTSRHTDLAQWHAVIEMRRDAIPFINVGLKPILHRDEGLEASTDMSSQ